MKYTISYAQNYEDILLDALLAYVSQGYYVDVGANHPIVDSVTKFFYLKGWQGINIEPVRSLHEALTLDRPRDVNLNVGVADKPGTLSFTEYEATGLSTFSDAIKSSTVHPATKKFQHYEVQVDTLANILDQHKLPHIHFLKIDVEGFEYEVLAGNDWKRFKPEVICIEANHIVKDWHSLLKQQKYQLAHFDGLNEYYVSPAAQHRIKLFRETYPDRALDGSTIRYRHYERITAADRRIQSLHVQLGHINQENENLKLHLNHLRHQLAAPRGLKPQVLALIRSIDRGVLVRLERLEHRAQERQRRHIAPSEVSLRATTPAELLATIQAADTASYWDNSGTPLLPQILRWTFQTLLRLRSLCLGLLRSIKLRRRHA
jgi:FkbM family methyltransferase